MERIWDWWRSRDRSTFWAFLWLFAVLWFTAWFVVLIAAFKILVDLPNQPLPPPTQPPPVQPFQPRGR